VEGAEAAAWRLAEVDESDVVRSDAVEPLLGEAEPAESTVAVVAEAAVP
jgi:hypothetical protein